MSEFHSCPPRLVMTKLRHAENPDGVTTSIGPVCLAFGEMSKDDEASPAAPSARDVLRDMWAARRNEALTDLVDLQSDLESLAGSPFDAELRSRAQARAHQLVGVFGVFGFGDLKNQMAHVDIELSDAQTPIDTLIDRVDEIVSDLP